MRRRIDGGNRALTCWREPNILDVAGKTRSCPKGFAGFSFVGWAFQPPRLSPFLDCRMSGPLPTRKLYERIRQETLVPRLNFLPSNGRGPRFQVKRAGNSRSFSRVFRSCSRTRLMLWSSATRTVVFSGSTQKWSDCLGISVMS